MRRVAQRVSIARQIASLEQALRQTESQMAALQRRYEETAERLQALRGLSRLLKAEGFRPDSALTWTGICRLKEWGIRGGGAHRTVRRRDQRLHVLLHRAAFGETCFLDRATYPLM